MKNYTSIWLTLLFLISTNFISTACNVTIDVFENSIQINGMDDDNINAKVFDEDWNIVWECNAWTMACTNSETIENLEEGLYRISVESANCQFYEIIAIDDGGVTDLCSIILTEAPGQLTIDGIVGDDINVNVFNENDIVVWNCNFWSNDNCNETEIIDIPGGNYAVAIQSSLCNFYETVSILPDEEENDCGFIKTIAVPNAYKNAISAYENEEGNYVISLELNNTDFYNLPGTEIPKFELTIDENGNQISYEEVAPQVDFQPYETFYDIDTDDGNIYFRKVTETAEVIWEEHVNFELDGYLTGSNEAIELEDKVIFVGTYTGGATFNLKREYLYTVVFDLEGTFISLNIEEDNAFGADFISLTGFIRAYDDRVVFFYNRGDDGGGRRVTIDLNGAFLSNDSFFIPPTTSNNMWLSNNEEILFSWLQGEVNHYFSTYNLTGSIDDTFGLPFECLMNYTGQGMLNVFLLPLDDKGAIFGLKYTPNFVWGGDEEPVTVYVRVNNEGEILWCENFNETITIENVNAFVPVLETSTGDLIFAQLNSTTVNNDALEIVVFKTNADGVILEDCEEEPNSCSISLTVSDQQLTIDGIVGDDINTNVFNENGEVVWSCNYWSGDNCSQTEILDLPTGNYAVAVQSSICSFYEMATVDVIDIEEDLKITLDCNDTTGDNFCVDVVVSNFNEILSMQYSMIWDPSVLQFQNVSGIAIENMGMDNFANNNSGVLSLSWFDDTVLGINVPDLTAVYQVCFSTIGAAGSATSIEIVGDPTPIEITNGNFNSIGLEIETCTYEIVNTDNTDDLAVMLNCDNTTEDNFCVDVSVSNFNDILSMQYSMTWDPTVLQYESVIGFSIENMNEMNLGFVGPGVLTLSWFDDTVIGMDVPDGTVIYQVCFSTIGEEGSNSAIEIGGVPSAIEIFNGNFIELGLNFENCIYETLPILANRNESFHTNNKAVNTSFSTINAFPNPFNDQLYIQLSNLDNNTRQIETNKNSKTELTIYDVVGNVIYKRAVELNSDYHFYTINTKDWPNGIYFLKTKNSMDEIKIVKQD